MSGERSTLNQYIVAGAAVEHVRAPAAEQHIVARAAEQRVVAGPAEQNIVAVAAVQGQLCSGGAESAGIDDVIAAQAVDVNHVGRIEVLDHHLLGQAVDQQRG